MVAKVLVDKNGMSTDFGQARMTEELGVSMKNVWKLEVPENGVKIAVLREWLKSNYLGGKKGETMVFWIDGADNLSETCQSVLLKPLEEARNEVLFVLTVKSESRLLPTVVSRCRVKRLAMMGLESINDYEEEWRELIGAWKGGLGESLYLVDKWAGGNIEELLERFCLKLARGLRELPSRKKVAVLNLCLELRGDLRLMVSPKLVLGRFLLEGGKVVGLDS